MWPCNQLSCGAEPADRCTERRWEIRDCRQPHPVDEAPSRRAHRVMGQNHYRTGGQRRGPGLRARGTRSTPIRLGLIYFHGARPRGHASKGIRKWGPLWWLWVSPHKHILSAHRGGLLRGVKWGSLGRCGGSRSSDRRAYGVRVHTGRSDRGAPPSSDTLAAVCGPGRDSESGAPSVGPGTVLVWFGVVACRAGHGWKRPMRGGQ